MTLAKAIMETGIKPDKTLVFALWTAEEKGLLGSRYYIQNLTYPIKNLRLNYNFDMISRYMSDNESRKVALVYSESCPVLRTITEEISGNTALIWISIFSLRKFLPEVVMTGRSSMQGFR